MSFMGDLKKEKDICVGIARSFLPYETGNMMFNATYGRLTHNGFIITFDLAKAYYIYFQEEGTKFSTKNQGMIANRAYPAVASYLNAKFNTKNEDIIKHYQRRGVWGNYDDLKYDKSTLGMEDRDLRTQKAYDSKLADMVTYNHISNAYNWSHNKDYEQEITDLNVKL